jgi:hypothetical protein
VPRTLRLPLWLCLLALAGCGGSNTSHGQTAAVPSTTTTSAPAVDELSAAERPTTAQFPPAHGHSLQQLAGSIHGQAQFGAATGTYTPGARRLAFALTTSSNQFIYAPTAIYLATKPNAPAQGPFLAPADPTGVPPQFRSAQNAGPGGLKAIYETYLPLSHPGVYDVLTLTRTSQGMIGAPGQVAVAASSTDSLSSVHGNVSLLTTRTPPEQMHSASFNQVLGKQPVALLFSTPELCTSRVCGPVTDVAVYLQQQFGSRITFIHQEVYVDNKPTQGLRPQLKAFHLETEPWLFTINRRGLIAARLEGTFGINALRQALQAALH